jgi:Rieske 2Fe-2S family protein
MSRLCGIFGRPYMDPSELVDSSSFDELDEEIVCALSRVEPSYTGGSLKWMGATAPWVNVDPYADYMHVFERFSPEELVRFVSYGTAPEGFDPDRPGGHEHRSARVRSRTPVGRLGQRWIRRRGLQRRDDVFHLALSESG